MSRASLHVLRIALCVLVLMIVAVVSLRTWTHLRADGRIFPDVASAPTEPVAIVFGAGIRRGKPTPMLYDRIETAAALYHAGKVSQVVMSGHAEAHYSEPAVMRQTALELGVPDAAIVIDEEGHSTFDTCAGAERTSGGQHVILVTQAFHLDRALLLCDEAGLYAVGVSADRRVYLTVWWNQLRELPATVRAMWDIWYPRAALGVGIHSLEPHATRPFWLA